MSSRCVFVRVAYCRLSTLCTQGTTQTRRWHGWEGKKDAVTHKKLWLRSSTAAKTSALVGLADDSGGTDARLSSFLRLPLALFGSLGGTMTRILGTVHSSGLSTYRPLITMLMIPGGPCD